MSQYCSLRAVLVCLLTISSLNWNSTLLQADDSLRPTPVASLQELSCTKSASTVFESSIALSNAKTESKSPTTVKQVAKFIADQSQTGSLLFSRGDCLAVKACTGSRFTHVATIVFIDGTPWIYDSMNGCGVRKLPLLSYLEVQSPDELTLFHPRRPLTEVEFQRFQQALDQEVGRTYSVSHFVTGRKNAGLHCAEYLTCSLISIEWLQAENPARVSPASLLEGISGSGLYVDGGVVPIPQPLVPIPEVANWREALWQDTKMCCQGSCRQLSRWILCR